MFNQQLSDNYTLKEKKKGDNNMIIPTGDEILMEEK